MIDWPNLFANSLWIFGLALALAVLSYASWQSSLVHGSMRQYVGLPRTQALLNLAGILFSAGLAATSQRWWEIGLWLLIAVAFFIQICLIWRGEKI
jgi:hypothetical protein